MNHWAEALCVMCAKEAAKPGRWELVILPVLHYCHFLWRSTHGWPNHNLRLHQECEKVELTGKKSRGAESDFLFPHFTATFIILDWYKAALGLYLCSVQPQLLSMLCFRQLWFGGLLYNQLLHRYSFWWFWCASGSSINIGQRFCGDQKHVWKLSPLKNNSTLKWGWGA